MQIDQIDNNICAMAEQLSKEEQEFERFIAAIRTGYSSLQSVLSTKQRRCSELPLQTQSLAQNLSSDNLPSTLQPSPQETTSPWNSSNSWSETEQTSTSKIAMSKTFSSTSAETVLMHLLREVQMRRAASQLWPESGRNRRLRTDSHVLCCQREQNPDR